MEVLLSDIFKRLLESKVCFHVSDSESVSA